MTNDEIRELIRLATETGVAELEVQRGENRVRIRNSFGAETSFVVPQTAAPVTSSAAPPKAETPAGEEKTAL